MNNLRPIHTLREAPRDGSTIVMVLMDGEHVEDMCEARWDGAGWRINALADFKASHWFVASVSRPSLIGPPE